MRPYLEMRTSKGDYDKIRPSQWALQANLTGVQIRRGNLDTQYLKITPLKMKTRKYIFIIL